MGQTLTHGVYLPDEGERNCYNGLAANWNILDGAVGTVAEHTAALSGKAPLVHTHTKSDITDFPAYGNAAGTICEGNDSRLSDARTPLSHTHTKSDITNLFNSANTWTDHNTYTKYIYMQNSSIEIGSAPSNNTSKEITFTDKNNVTLNRVLGKAESSGNSYIALHATNKFTNGALDPNGSSVNSYFYVGIESDGTPYNKHAAHTLPNANNTYDLGSSLYQWNNLYAKNYYYNGTQWGLDQANVWSANNIFTYTVTAKRPTAMSANSYGVGFEFKNYQNTRLGYIQPYLTSHNENYIIYGADNGYNAFASSCIPTAGSTLDLGTSTNKWKTINGCNPGALSLPDMGTTADVNYFDFTSSITHFDGTHNYYTPTVDGWMTVITAGTELDLFEDRGQSNAHYQGSAASSTAVQGYCFCTIPVHKDIRVRIRVVGTSVYMAQVRPCMGNV